MSKSKSVAHKRAERADKLRHEIELTANLEYRPFESFDSPWRPPNFKMIHELRQSGLDPELLQVKCDGSPYALVAAAAAAAVSGGLLCGECGAHP